MRINNNQAATNTHRIMNKTMGYQAKVSEKLASGLRINRAADDASGLAISEKMRAQKRGLNMASRNCTDGISLVQTAEGGLTEMSEILQRIRELSVQSATGTYTAEDRVAMQDEANELIKELDSISTETKFNKKSLLDGKIDKDGNFVPTGSLAEDVQHITPDGGTTEKYEKDGVSYASAVIDFSNINSAKDMANLVGKGTNYTCCTCTKAYSIKFIDWEPDISGLGKDNPVMEVDIRGLTGGTELARKIMETAAGSEFVNHYSKIAVEGGKLYI
ncbi:MAG TPA: flagellin [Epulopiscium sp.]|nr:flagellin [Candidatus Epulonipiscium sp.]